MNEHKIELVGELPPFYKISDVLWGVDADIDSDGNSETANSTNWNELTLILRRDREQRVDIDPDEFDERYLIVSSKSEDLVMKTINYLKEYGAAK